MRVHPPRTSTESTMLLAAAILALAVTSASAACRGGATQVRGRCMQFYGNKKTFAGAKAACEANEAQLFLVNGNEENDKMVEEFAYDSQSVVEFYVAGGGLIWDADNCVVIDTTKYDTDPNNAIYAVDCDTKAAYICVSDL